ncbi:MAG: PemK family transcriptional regulator [Firmicutes bacterium ML8_F2]|jgi:mRNA interferase MazF|nr:MAG: PemK family transcriptional regulator [Firmicutes bacterium ML8_F2]
MAEAQKLLSREPITDIKRGSVYHADLNPVLGSEQGGERPVLVIQNDVGNRYSPTIIVAAITSHIHKPDLPTHVKVSSRSGLAKDSIIMLEQIRTIDKRRLISRVAAVDEKTMRQVDRALKISLDLF